MESNPNEDSTLLLMLNDGSVHMQCRYAQKGTYISKYPLFLSHFNQNLHGSAFHTIL